MSTLNETQPGIRERTLAFLRSFMLSCGVTDDDQLEKCAHRFMSKQALDEYGLEIVESGMMHAILERLQEIRQVQQTVAPVLKELREKHQAAVERAEKAERALALVMQKLPQPTADQVAERRNAQPRCAKCSGNDHQTPQCPWACKHCGGTAHNSSYCPVILKKPEPESLPQPEDGLLASLRSTGKP